jgi:hypothetical protein
MKNYIMNVDEMTEYFNQQRALNPNFDKEENERFKESLKHIEIVDIE